MALQYEKLETLFLSARASPSASKYRQTSGFYLQQPVFPSFFLFYQTPLVSVSFNQTSWLSVRLSETLWASVRLLETPWASVRLYKPHWDSLSLSQSQRASVSMSLHLQVSARLRASLRFPASASESPSHLNQSLKCTMKSSLQR